MNQTEKTHGPHPAAPGNRRSLLKWALMVLPLAFLWFHLVDNLRLEWSSNPQYSYGLVVPLLVAGLLLRRWLQFPGCRRAAPVVNPRPALCLCALLALLYLPSRLVEEATPSWRPLQWLIVLEVIGLTLCAVWLAGGKNWLKLAVFPLTFFLVAVPWPSPVETPLIQHLSRLNAAGVAEILGLLGVPAIPHGNLVEVATGVVGINDACSGIRSFQSSLMIALFLGEFFFFTWPRRLLLVPAGFALAMGLNLGRTSLLTWLAAKQGLGAIARYHDEAGLTILLVCTAGLWLLAWLMSLRKSKIVPPPAVEPPRDEMPLPSPLRLAVILLIWLACAETAVALWYHIRESRLQPGPNWSVYLPEANPTFTAVPPTDSERVLLQFDHAIKGRWQEDDGTAWQAYYFDWKPGRVAGYLAKRHTPDICLTATGLRQSAGPRLKLIKVHGVELPMRAYTFESAGGPIQVFQCHWEAGLAADSYTADESARFNLIRGIWAGRGNQGQKVLEIVITGCDDLDKAEQAVANRLEQIIKVEEKP